MAMRGWAARPARVACGKAVVRAKMLLLASRSMLSVGWECATLVNTEISFWYPGTREVQIRNGERGHTQHTAQGQAQRERSTL
mmetsp:Transcript_41138/g.108989  ORF Transcript_41138/g.108989 Transcript_41138/m.108989 type:complete len:83 (-) Transcript_41138:25-273(-)